MVTKKIGYFFCLIGTFILPLALTFLLPILLYMSVLGCRNPTQLKSMERVKEGQERELVRIL